MKIEILDITKEIGITRFKELETDILAILRNAYNENYYGDAFTVKRLFSEKQILFLLFDANKLEGVSIIRPDGKIAAFAVLKEYQRKGLGAELVRAAIHFFDYQFVEVSPQNDKFISLLSKFGFKSIDDEIEVKTILPNESKFIIKFHKINDFLVYERLSSLHKIPIHHFFRLFVFKK